MNMSVVGMPEWIDALVLAVGWALVSFLIQGLMIGLGVAAILRASRGRSAELRHAVALAGLLLMAACPPATVSWNLATNPGGTAPRRPVTSPPSSAIASIGELIPAREVVPGPALKIEAVPAAPALRTNPSPDWRTRIEGWLPVVVAIWLLGVCASAMRLTLGFVEVRRLTRDGIETAPEEVLSLIGRLLNRLGRRGPVRCFLSRRIEVPSVVGWLRPTILIPMATLARLTAKQLEALLAHELAHVRRLDFLVNAIQAILETLLFFHPAVWWVSKRIRDEREHCCDDLAVALCDGDRLLVARTLLTLEEMRSAPVLRVAATGGSLRDRITRLASPASADPRRGGAGWVGAGLMAVAAGVVAVGWHAGTSRAQGQAAQSGEPRIRGRVLDGQGKPVEGAQVRLYRRENRWERINKLVEETRSGADGSFRLNAPPEPASSPKTRDFPPRVLLADHPRHAVGWRIIPDEAATFQGEIVLTEPIERTITVVDEGGRPVKDATVTAYSLGDPSSPSPRFRELLELRVKDGSLVAVTDAGGKATLSRLPRMDAYFLARKPGFAETYAFREQNSIRLKPSASLSGTLTGPSGEPLAGVKIVLHAEFLWDFEYATTDEQGRYRFEGLKAKGWDMSAWRPGRTGTGIYKLWIESERFVAPTRTITFGPGERQTLDIRAEKAAVVRATVVEEGTGKPMAGVKVWGFDLGGTRFDADTDERGRATFYTTPAEVSLAIAGPPEGTYIAGDLTDYPGTHKSVDIQGGEKEVVFKMPPIAGPLVTFSGVCTRPDGSPASGATIQAWAGRTVTLSGTNYIRPRRADDKGAFTLEGVPAGRVLELYAESEDGRFAGAVLLRCPDRSDSPLRASLPLRTVVTVERKIEGDRGVALASREFDVTPKIGEDDFPPLRRTVKSDKEGKIQVDRVVPNLTYRVQAKPVILRLEGGLFKADKSDFDRNLVLAPE